MEFRNLKKQYEVLKKEIDGSVQKVCANSNFISGAEVKELESELAQYVGTRHCITCANGTDALTLALMTLGIGEGDCVFVPDFTFFATAETVSFEGAVPIFVDVDYETFNICPKSLEKAIEETLKNTQLKPRAIITVDLFGLPADYAAIKEIADRYSLKLVEDGAQGFGGNIKGKNVCSFADIATTSFFPAKPLGCYGDGGAIFTDGDEQEELIRSYAVHGKNSEDKYNNIRIGMNSRLDTIQAAVLLAKFKAFKEHELEDVNRAAQYYTRELFDRVKTPTIPQGFYSSWAQYTIKLEGEAQRNELMEFLKAKDIPTMVYYPRTMSEQGALAQYLGYQPFECAVAKKLCRVCVSLPIGPYITKPEQDRVIDAIKEFLSLR
ncbi:MAG: DegT/DnrJ/EryC1/StrS family aminotransferase [Oscillospiraceae bacterium]